MWFWINFSPIGRAPPTPKTASDLQDEEKPSEDVETEIEGLFSCFLLIINFHLCFSSVEGKKLEAYVGEVAIRDGVCSVSFIVFSDSIFRLHMFVYIGQLFPTDDVLFL